MQHQRWEEVPREFQVTLSTFLGSGSFGRGMGDWTQRSVPNACSVTSVQSGLEASRVRPEGGYPSVK